MRSWSDFMHVESVKRPRCTAMFFYVLDKSCQVTFHSSLNSESRMEFRKETHRYSPAHVCFLLRLQLSSFGVLPLEYSSTNVCQSL